MNLKELKWPVRIYWDLPEHPDPSLVAGVCEELAALKILFLSLHGSAAASCADILAMLKGKNPAVSLTLPGEALNPEVLAGLPGTGIRNLLAGFSSLRGAEEWFDGEVPSGQYSIRPGLAFDVKGTSHHEIPEVVSLCLRKGIGDLVFPIQRLTGDAEVFCLTGEMRAGLAAVMGGLDFRRLRITIHDPFLWQVFFPEADYHEGGCQAANSMLYISPGFKVFPCPAMPLELGDLHDTPLKEIILSANKQGLRRSLREAAGDCLSCELAVKCLGGCRGRALAAEGSLDRRDPACDL